MADVEWQPGDEKADAYFTVPADTCSSIRLAPESGEGGIVIALVFHERLAHDIADFLADRYEQPDDTVMHVRLESVHPDEIERWARGKSE